MQPEICRDLFTHGSRSADIAVVEGQYDTAGGETLRVAASTSCASGWTCRKLPSSTSRICVRVASCGFHPASMDCYWMVSATQHT